MEYASPAVNSSTLDPVFMECTRSDSMNTVQRSPNLQGDPAQKARPSNSCLILMPRRSACSSKNDPVPASKVLFISKSTTASFVRLINLESCPPSLKMVSTDGSI